MLSQKEEKWLWGFFLVGETRPRGGFWKALFLFHRAHFNSINQLNISRIFYWAKTCSKPIKIAKKKIEMAIKMKALQSESRIGADAPHCQEIKIIWIVVRCDAFNAHLPRTRAILLNFFSSSLINSTTEKSFYCAKKERKKNCIAREWLEHTSFPIALFMRFFFVKASPNVFLPSSFDK